jgi:hypothetical protein
MRPAVLAAWKKKEVGQPHQLPQQHTFLGEAKPGTQMSSFA